MSQIAAAGSVLVVWRAALPHLAFDLAYPTAGEGVKRDRFEGAGAQRRVEGAQTTTIMTDLVKIPRRLDRTMDKAVSCTLKSFPVEVF